MPKLLAEEGTIWRRAAMLVLACAALAALTSADNLHAAFIELLEVARAGILRNPLSGALMFVLLCALSAMLAFVSIAALVPVAVYVWGVPPTLLLVWIGWVLGGICAYSIARFWGRVVVKSLVRHSALARLERYVDRNMSFGMILLFQLAMPSEIPGYVLGVARYSFRKYLLALSIAEIPYVVATVLLSENFVERRGGVIMVIGGGMVLVSLGLFYLLRHRIQRSGRPASQESDPMPARKLLKH